MSPITLGNVLTANRLCEKCRPAMSRPWTRATELQYRKVYKLSFSVSFMASGLLKKVALAGMVGASAMFGANEVKAATVPWSSYTDLVPTISPDVEGNPFGGQSIPSITYSSPSSVSVSDNISAVYFLVDNGLHFPVGGFDVRNGVVTSASFNGFGNWYGLSFGETANSSEGSNPQNMFPGIGGFFMILLDWMGV